MVDGKIRLVLFDERRIRREGMKSLLEKEHDIDVTCSSDKTDEMISFIKLKKPDVLVVSGPYYPLALEIMRAKEISANTRVVIISSTRNIFSPQMIAGGIMGLVLVTSGMAELLSAIRSAAKNVQYIDPNIPENWMEVSRLRKLSVRELDIFHLIAQGMDNATIAAQMYISERTVKNHVSHILSKLSLQNRTQVAVYAWSHEIASIPPSSLVEMLRRKRGVR